MTPKSARVLRALATCALGTFAFGLLLAGDSGASRPGGARVHEAVAGAGSPADFYFVHSYRVAPAGEAAVIATASYGGDYPAAARRG